MYLSSRSTPSILLALLTLLALAGSSFAQADKSGGEWCHTQIIYAQKYGLDDPEKEISACAAQGTCDSPGERDSWIPAGPSSPIFVKIFFHVFREDNGSNAACTATNVLSQVNTLNADYAIYNIQFEYDMEFVNSTEFRNLTAESEFNAMKIAHAIKPDSQINIYVASVNVGGEVFSFATFPWDSDALSATGGIVMNRTQFVPFDNGTLTHEMGHCLGLWHTHHGVSEVTQCGPCYETPGAADGDLTGDLCSDTDPTPVNFFCSPPGGSDPCTSLPWGTTDTQNYMGYAPSSCYTEFSPQQTGRMHCWISDRLTSQTIALSIAALPSPPFGPAPLSVDFTGESGREPTSWAWTFGDGGTADIQNPSHEYTDPGYYTVSLTVETAEGPFVNESPGFVSVFADTAKFNDGVIDESIVSVDVDLTNFLPVKTISFPVDYSDGTLNLRFDSITTTGTRTDGFNSIVVNNFLAGKKAAVEIDAGSLPYLAPGTGTVGTVWFTNLGATGSTNVTMTPYAAFEPLLLAAAGEYPPETLPGQIVSGCCMGKVGDANNSGDDVPTVADIGAIVDHLFISGAELVCYGEADANQSGGTSPDSGDITIADVGIIVDHLFISGNPLPDCL